MTMPSGAILLGYGGSEHSKFALSWADQLATKLGRPLHVLVSALDVIGAPDIPREHHTAQIMDELEALLAQATAPGTSIASVLDAPGAALVRIGADAHLTVLGARTQGPLKQMVTGSVSQFVTRNSTRPVVVVREPHTPHSGNILVGVDGSEQSQKALTFAIDHANAVGAKVVVMHVHTERSTMPEQKVREIIDAASHVHENVLVETHHADGDAASVLAEASQKADLLVTGTRGKGLMHTLLVGSVAQSVLQSAQCPVAVVR